MYICGTISIGVFYIYVYVRGKKVIECSQHGFTKSKSCLTHLIAFYREMTVSVDEEKAVDVFILTLKRFLILSLIPSSLTI